VINRFVVICCVVANHLIADGALTIFTESHLMALPRDVLPVILSSFDSLDGRDIMLKILANVCKEMRLVVNTFVIAIPNSSPRYFTYNDLNWVAANGSIGILKMIGDEELHKIRWNEMRRIAEGQVCAYIDPNGQQVGFVDYDKSCERLCEVILEAIPEGGHLIDFCILRSRKVV
jgi:hypothetical protein